MKHFVDVMQFIGSTLKVVTIVRTNGLWFPRRAMKRIRAARNASKVNFHYFNVNNLSQATNNYCIVSFVSVLLRVGPNLSDIGSA